MKQLAEDVWQLKGLLPNVINTYLVGDVLIDAAAKADWRVIRKELQGRPLAAHALTHAHGDHQGCSHKVCETFGVPFWVPERDVAKAERPQLIKDEQPKHPINTLFFKLFAGPGHPVDRALKEGDEVGGFTVLETPGHSKGHVSFWRESDRVLILGDVANNMDTITLIPGLREPKTFFTPDPVTNRQSLRRLGELEPSLVCFGHGAPVRDTEKFVSFVRSLG